MGWKGVLLEPLPSALRKLRTRYERNPRVRVVPAAICSDAAARNMSLWSIDGSSTKSYGNNESDIRCIGDALRHESASLSKAGLLAHSVQMRFTPAQCLRCEQIVGRALPPTCLKRAIFDNIISSDVPCANMRELLSTAFAGDKGATDLQQPGEARPPHVLEVDAEGLDTVVLERYLKSGLRAPPVVIFEQSHMRGSQRSTTGAMLKRNGMVPFNLSRIGGAERARHMPALNGLWHLLDPPRPMRNAMNSIWVRKELSA
jgi:hypothetical protein